MFKLFKVLNVFDVFRTPNMQDPAVSTLIEFVTADGTYFATADGQIFGVRA